MTFPAPLVVAAAGDVFINRADPATALAHVAGLLQDCDLRFANNEGVYSETCDRAPSAGFAVVAPPRMAEGLRPAQFDVMSCANNHTLDAGHGGLHETLHRLSGLGVRPVGAGSDRKAARSPVFVEANGRRVAILAYTSVFQPGYEARDNVPGVSVLRVHTAYYHADWDPYGRLEPGSKPQVRTFPYPEDLAAMQVEIAAAASEADIVLVSCHWGDSRRVAVLHDYELCYGRAAIDAGAHAVFGHHHHFLRGAEIYKGKPIFYGLGHLVFDLVGLDVVLQGEALRRAESLGPYAIYPRGDPAFPFHDDARMTALAFCTFDRGAVSATLLPCLIADGNAPIPCGLETEAGRRILDYLREISAEAGLMTRYAPALLPIGEMQGIGIE